MFEDCKEDSEAETQRARGGGGMGHGLCGGVDENLLPPEDSYDKDLGINLK